MMTASGEGVAQAASVCARKGTVSSEAAGRRDPADGRLMAELATLEFFLHDSLSLRLASLPRAKEAIAAEEALLRKAAAYHDVATRMVAGLVDVHGAAALPFDEVLSVRWHLARLVDGVFFHDRPAAWSCEAVVGAYGAFAALVPALAVILEGSPLLSDGQAGGDAARAGESSSPTLALIAASFTLVYAMACVGSLGGATFEQILECAVGGEQGPLQGSIGAEQHYLLPFKGVRDALGSDSQYRLALAALGKGAAPKCVDGTLCIQAAAVCWESLLPQLTSFARAVYASAIEPPIISRFFEVDAIQQEAPACKPEAPSASSKAFDGPTDQAPAADDSEAAGSRSSQATPPSRAWEEEDEEDGPAAGTAADTYQYTMAAFDTQAPFEGGSEALAREDEAASLPAIGKEDSAATSDNESLSLDLNSETPRTSLAPSVRASKSAELEPINFGIDVSTDCKEDASGGRAPDALDARSVDEEPSSARHRQEGPSRARQVPPMLAELASHLAIIPGSALRTSSNMSIEGLLEVFEGRHPQVRDFLNGRPTKRKLYTPAAPEDAGVPAVDPAWDGENAAPSNALPVAIVEAKDGGPALKGMYVGKRSLLDRHSSADCIKWTPSQAHEDGPEDGAGAKRSTTAAALLVCPSSPASASD